MWSEANISQAGKEENAQWQTLKSPNKTSRRGGA